MDLKAIIGKFVGPDGAIAIPAGLTIPAMAEMLYQAAGQAGRLDATSIRFWDYSEDAEGKDTAYSRSEVNTRIKAVAARLAQVGAPGDRVAILAGNSPEYIFAFMGALYAGQVPVPLYDPNEPGHEHHLKAVLGDSGARVVLTNKQGAPAVRAYFSGLPAAERPRIMEVGSLPDSLAQAWEPIAAPAGDIAFLQYTSGSTRAPAGVELTNTSIVTNVLQMYFSVGVEQPLRIASWLPLHHDMGVILATLGVVLGDELEIFAPRDFVQQPKRWMDRLTRRAGDPDDMHIYTVAPNFALELAARYAAAEDPQEYDFSQVTAVIIGSESVTKPSVEAFMEAFGPSGLAREALRPSYGLAEATLIVATPQTAERPRFAEFDRAALAEGRALLVDAPSAGTDTGADTVSFTSNGQPVVSLHLAIVDPETRAELPEGQVGEIWLNGPNAAAGYLDRPEATQATFHNTIGETRTPGLPAEHWLATGDLGVLVDGGLYITGRVKDMVVVAGRNHYPQDIEATVMEASDHVRRDSVAAFAVPGDDVERLVLLVERADDAGEEGDAAAEDAIRAAVTQNHGISPDVIEFSAPNTIQRSSSGKIARRVNAKRWLEAAEPAGGR